MHSPPLIPLLFGALVACSTPATDAPAGPAPSPGVTARAAPPKAARKPGQNMVLDVALGSPDHTTLVTAVAAAGLADALGSPGGVYTVFAPTNAAFAALPAGTVEGLLQPEKKADLKAIIQHHAAVPILPLSSFKDGDTLTMADGKKVTFQRNGDVLTVDGANILGTVQATNGVVYVVDQVLLPKG